MLYGTRFRVNQMILQQNLPMRALSASRGPAGSGSLTFQDTHGRGQRRGQCWDSAQVSPSVGLPLPGPGPDHLAREAPSGHHGAATASPPRPPRIRDSHFCQVLHRLTTPPHQENKKTKVLLKLTTINPIWECY